MTDPSAAASSSIRPFEWLTSPASLGPILEPLLSNNKDERTALHVGCGSSSVGEYLVRSLGFTKVVNVDKDEATLNEMAERWNRIAVSDERDSMHFQYLDFTASNSSTTIRPSSPNSSKFHLVLDKSTLDCTLCSDEATTGLICEVYRNLAVNGHYVLISFHHVDLLQPLLENCPGTDWHVTHTVMRRQVEDLIGGNRNNNLQRHDVDGALLLEGSTDKDASVWSTGEFVPTEGYGKTVNVLLCKRLSDDGQVLDRARVHEHILSATNDWYKKKNPMLSDTRKEYLAREFGGETKSLRECYMLLFTDEEREQLEFSFFLEDVKAFADTHANDSIETSGMTLKTALNFLEDMQ